jgi:endonuclease/exonuclease/phosphatase family metal-dependent hydrolase
VNRRAFIVQTLTSAATSSIKKSNAHDPFNTVRIIGSFAPAPPSRRINVVTWNIERGTNLSSISTSLASCNGDLMLLQEVDSGTQRTGFADIAVELSKRLQQNAAYGIEFEELSQEQGGKPAYIGQATFTRLPIVNSRVLRFHKQSGFWKPHSWIPSSVPLMQRRQGNRIALVTELRFNGKILVVYNVHLESRSMGLIQAAQLDEILADSARYSRATPILLGGDLNTKYFPSTFLHKLERAGFQSALGERIARTHTIMMSLDWLFARGPVKWGSGTVEQMLHSSDHYPVTATLTQQ